MRSAGSFASLLTDPDLHPLLSSEAAFTLGSAVIVAPHPDDESLGCGGLLALLAQGGYHPRVLVMTDGSRSHPGSHSHPPTALAAIREQETLAALAELGVAADAAIFLRFPDCGLPKPGTPSFDAAMAKMRTVLTSWDLDTILVPWRRDPHCDHEGTWRLLREACLTLPRMPRWLEYPVWAWMQPEGDVAPRAHEAHAWRLEITSVLERKAKAIAQHRSQLGEIIHDDPTGFALRPEMLAHFSRPWELYLEPHHV